MRKQGKKMQGKKMKVWRISADGHHYLASPSSWTPTAFSSARHGACIVCGLKPATDDIVSFFYEHWDKVMESATAPSPNQLQRLAALRTARGKRIRTERRIKFAVKVIRKEGRKVTFSEIANRTGIPRSVLYECYAEYVRVAMHGG
jgi:hypothetical protein